MMKSMLKSPLLEFFSNNIIEVFFRRCWSSSGSHDKVGEKYFPPLLEFFSNN